MIIERKQELDTLRGLLSRHPVVGIVGARQVGKTTLARQLASDTQATVTHFDLENPEDLARLHDPMLALKDLQGVHFLVSYTLPILGFLRLSVKFQRDAGRFFPYRV